MKNNKVRLGSMMAILGLVAALMIARYAQLAVAGDAAGASLAGDAGERGAIVDRNGRELAMDVPKYNVSIWRPSTKPELFVKEIPELARLLGLSAADIASRYQDGSQNYFYLAKRLSAETVAPIQEAQKAVVGPDGKKTPGQFRGVQIEEISGRLYPEGRLASHLIGFTGEGNAGLDGIELKYDAELQPKARKLADGTGRRLEASAKVPRGDTVTLSIDANLQYMIEDILEKAVAANGAESAFAIAMDVNSGEILSYVSAPEFDLNAYGSYDQAVRRDLLSLYSYEPGSVFKMFSMASILDMGAITTQTVFNCDGAYRRTLPNGQKIVIKDLGVYGMQTLSGVLAHSSNAGVGYASDRVSEADLYTRLKSFGFGAKTGIALSGESSGSLKEPEKWSGRSKPTIAIGQEVLVTPLQMITAAASIANGGTLIKPTTVKRIDTADGDPVFVHEPQVINRVVSRETARAILDAMETTASMQGTGWRAKVSDIRMAVKTGTAQMIDPKTRAYSDTDYIASTLGIFPADEPRIVLYLAIIKPRGASYLGGQIAAPVLHDAAEAVLSCIDIERGKSPTVVHEGSVVLSAEAPAEVGEVMPDLTGRSKRALLPLLDRKDLKVVIEGDGYVAAQQPAPGSPIGAGAQLIFSLK